MADLIESPNPLKGVESNTMPNKDSSEMNSVVARITGMKHFFDEGLKVKQPLVESDVEQAQAAQPNRGPDSKVYGRDVDSVKRAMPKKHEMPPKKPDEKQPGGDEIDDKEQEVGKMETGSNEHVSFLKMTGLKNVHEWRSLAGLPPLTEDAARGTGTVPTPGANKENRMKGGLPGLEGTPMVNLQPQPVGDDGDDAEQTFDQDIAQLKKEEYERLFSEYLESRGVHPELFAHLVDEAAASGDVAEMDVLITVENDFRSKLKESLANKKPAPKMESKLKPAKFKNPRTGKVEKIPGVQLRESTDMMEVDCDDDGQGNPDWRGALNKLHKKLKSKRG